MSDQLPPDPPVPAWLADAAQAEPERVLLTVALPAAAYHQLVAQAAGDAAQAEALAAALLAERLAAWVNDLTPQIAALTAELASMRRQRDAALSVINKALGARRGAEAELRAALGALEGQGDG